MAELRQRKPIENDKQPSPVEAAFNWAYENLGGEEWDCQPACIITDYILAIQCFIFIGYLSFMSSGYLHEQSHWYVLYFFAMGTTALVGGFLHHVAFKAKKVFAANSGMPKRVFGMYLTQRGVDSLIDWSWRLVLGFTTLTNFVLVALAASRYLSDGSSELTIWIAGTGYSIVAVFAFIYMNTSFMLLGFLPAMLFGGAMSMTTFQPGWFHELVILFLKLASGLIQGLAVSPSSKHFNHNALSHVMLSAAAVTMFMHFHV
ncbi:transmembrane protein [Thraustotheca clavata]|uniref:Transmembrane protein n=1 Tax=Thraustotheca clavata TaxID=74557 RepID=A0A1W0A5M8_9STRA|nr:transmembrane protein [Thraustotheca clavata]